MNRAVSVRQVHGHSGFTTIYDDWFELMGSVSKQCFYQHPAWFRAYFERPDYEDDIYFRCVFYGEQLVAICPMVFRRPYGNVIREAALPSHDSLYMPDMVIADSASPHEVWGRLSAPDKRKGIERWDLFSANSVLENSTISRALHSLSDDAVYESRRGRCAIVDIVDYDDAIRNMRKKFRGNLNNAKNRLAAQASVDFSCITQPNEVDSAFEEFVALEQSGWKGNPEKKRADYPNPAAIGLKRSKYLFYKNVVREFSKIDSLEIYLLKVNGKTVGAQIYTVLNQSAYLLKTAFDEDSKKFSPGHVLLDFVYKRYSQEGEINQICLITDYEWFKYWNPRYFHYVNIKAFSATPLGQMASLAYSTLRKRKQKNEGLT